ncbi:MAG TPA: MFS transporter [Micromonosporaceae bacterium]|nr:MFS transporter [Micromonosporaceae bacterium]
MAERRRLVADMRPLRESPAFRRLWIGSGLSQIGSQMTVFAVVLQVFTITHSSLAVGAVGLATALPAIAFGMVGGSIADAVDRRRLVLSMTSLQAVISAVFATQAFLGVDQIWLLYVLVAVSGVVSSVNVPARRTFLGRLLPADRVPAGAALNMLAMHASITVGPALAGVIAGAWGLKVCYLVDAVSFSAALWGVGRLPAMPPEPGTARPGARAVLDGLRFIASTRVLVGALLADMSATVLAMPIALFPAINADHFGGSPRTLGLFTTSLAVGGIIGSTLSGPVGRVSRQGLAMLVAGGVWGLALVGFGLAHVLWLVLGALVVAGVADVTAVVFRTTLVQVATPDRYRGRVSAAEYVVGMGFPQLGNFRAGAIASATSPGVSAVSGGLAAVVGAGLIGLALPAFVRYRAPVSADAVPTNVNKDTEVIDAEALAVDRMLDEETTATG